jgi:hypothetical protein
VSVVCARGAKVINIKTMLIVSSRTSEMIYIYSDEIEVGME